jgi:site-specific DNA recombinase
MTKRAIAYARVSTTDQADRGESLPSQVKACQGYIDGVLGYQTLPALQEDASGGTRIVERPLGRRLFDMVNRGEVDAVVFHAADRMSRYLPDVYLTVEAWLKKGVEIYTMDIGRITDPNDITFVIKGWQAGDEKKKIRERTMRGRRQAIEGGRVVANCPAKYGYRFDGKRKETELAIVEAEAEAVKQVFSWYVYGNGDGRPVGVVSIADKLNALGVPTRQGGAWSPGLLYPILKHEIYAGTWYGYRFKMVEKNGRKSRQRRPREEWQPVSVPAIVDRQTWKKAQDRLAKGRHEGRETARHDYLLSGRLKCSCGYHVQGHPSWSDGKAYLYYACNGRSKTNTTRDCTMPRVRVSVWDAIAWNWVYDLMMHPEKLAQGMREEQDARRQQHAQLYARLEQANAKIAAYDGELDKLGRMLYKGQCDDAFHDREKAIIDRARSEMVEERERTAADLAVTVLTDEQIADFETFALEVQDGLEDASFADKRQYLQWLDFSGRFAWENGEPVLYARLEMVKGAEKRLSQDLVTR